MKQVKRVLSWSVFFSLFFFTGLSWAVLYSNPSGSFTIQGKIQAMGVMRTSDSPDTSPVPIESGDLVQQRNTLMADIKHNLGEVTEGLEMSYYIQPRIYYDGIWDYGPDVFSDKDVRLEYGLDNEDQIDDQKWDAEIFQGYLDMNWESLFIRTGRQVFQWGEMTTIRILDACIPVDNQSLAVDLEERLFPLIALRTGYSVHSLGPFATASVEGYYIPGDIEDHYGEETIDGSYVLPPIGRSNPAQASLTPPTVNIEPDDDRYGVRIGATLGELGFYLAHFRKYSDAPVARLDLVNNRVEKVIDVVDVYGGSFNYYWGVLDMVFRGEIGLFQDEPMTIGSALSPAVNMGSEVPTFDVLRYGIAIDKNHAIRALNPTKDFRTSFEYIRKTIKDFDEGLTYQWKDPDNGERLYVEENSDQVVFVVNTEYLNEKLIPTLTLIYDIGPKTFMVLPKMEFKLTNYSIDMSYRYTTSGTYENMGFLQDSNEFTLKLTYYF